MNRIDRLSAILIQLQSKKIVKAQEIADRFDISLRTVYRDIHALEEAGIPIGSEAGIGYFLSPDFHLPPVIFTKEEAAAFLLADKLMGRLSDAKVSKAFESALFKVKSVLRLSDKEHLENLENKISVYNYYDISVGSSGPNLYLQEIQIALASKKILEIEYAAFYNQQKSHRIIEPVSLCNYDMRWHLIAYCRLRNDYRDFRLDRIQTLNVKDEYFDGKNHISLNEYFKKITKENSLYTIQLRMHHSMFCKIGSSVYWYGLTEEKKEGDYHQLTFTHNNLHMFSKWLLRMEDKVKIIGPPELKTIIKEYILQLHRYYLQEGSTEKNK
jgi:predicted DNA-binding transcriptional regulator YafY